MNKGRILIIEDDRDIVEMIEYNLKEEGYQVTSAFEGEKGIELAKREKPDLIILDIMLPAIDGFEVCRSLKQYQPTAHIAVIIILIDVVRLSPLPRAGIYNVRQPNSA